VDNGLRQVRDDRRPLIGTGRDLPRRAVPR